MRVTPPALPLGRVRRRATRTLGLRRATGATLGFYFVGFTMVAAGSPLTTMVLEAFQSDSPISNVRCMSNYRGLFDSCRTSAGTTKRLLGTPGTGRSRGEPIGAGRPAKSSPIPIANSGIRYTSKSGRFAFPRAKPSSEGLFRGEKPRRRGLARNKPASPSGKNLPREHEELRGSGRKPAVLAPGQ
jgi:hypothetical protein